MKQNAKNVSPMSNEGRNTYVTEHITDALIALLSEKNIEDISISELCDKAGVGRASFYRNYESREEVIKEYITGLFQEWNSGWEDDGKEALSVQIRRIFAHFERYRDFYSMLNERGLVYLIKDVIIGMFGPEPDCDKVEAYSKAFFSYTIYGWIEVWFARGMRESPEEMAAMFSARGL